MIYNPSDDDNDETDDPESWDEEDGLEIEEISCPFCGGDNCGFVADDGIHVTCSVTGRSLP